ncbi:MAG TPA: N-acetyltransferase [Rhizomicrobium sp.]|nr:N-acetyltransferase [Rhizomicrobium sp.]
MKSQQSRAFTIEQNCDGRAAEVAGVVEAAFRLQYGNGCGEVALVAALRAADDAVAELVAVEEDTVVGHVMFSRMTPTPADRQIAALAPVCARIDRQNTGIGSALVRAGLDICRERGIGAVIVLGEPDYYGRFGFRAAKAEGIACVYAGPHLQALELIPDTLKGVTALAYAPAFSAV